MLWRDEERAGFEIECSSGTYVRQLIAGLGDAYCEELERIAIGPFKLADADPNELIPLDEALTFLPERALDDSEARKAANGVAVAAGQAPQGDAVRLTHGGRLIAVGRPESGGLKPFVVFPA